MDDSPKTSRRRAVQLTEEAAHLLEQNIRSTWEALGQSGPLTWSTRAAILEVSVNTARKILERKGNDRAVLELAFRQVGLEWKDEYSESISKGAAETQQNDSAITHHQFDRRIRLTSVIVFVLLGVALISGAVVSMSFRFQNTPESRQSIFRAASDAFHRGEYSAASENARRCIEKSRQASDANGMARAVGLYGQILGAEGHLEEAITQYERAKSIWNSFDDTNGSAYVSELLGVAHARLNELEVAESHFMKSLSEYEMTLDHGGMAAAARGMGSIFALRNDFKQARKWFERSRKYLDGVVDEPFLIELKALNALTLAEEGETNSALVELQYCHDFWNSTGHRRWVATSLFRIAYIRLLENNQRKAWESGRYAKIAFDSVGDTRNSRACESLLNAKSFEVTAPFIRAELYF